MSETPFKLKSGNTPLFKQMGSSPLLQGKKTTGSQKLKAGWHALKKGFTSVNVSTIRDVMDVYKRSKKSLRQGKDVAGYMGTQSQT